MPADNRVEEAHRKKILIKNDTHHILNDYPTKKQ